MCNETETPDAYSAQIAKVLGPAIKRGALVLSMRKPARHNDVIREAALAGVKTPIGNGDDTQGFMTIRGFMDREHTAKLIDHQGFLTSEDLW